jgi:prepilin-type N-terminal cleavage/methylation domain-containing protein
MPVLTPTRRFRDQRGFTILEVSLASFIMALGISTAIIAMQAGFKQIDVARGTTIASQILQSEMESIRLMSWAEVAALPASAEVDVATFFSSSTVAANYHATVTVADDAYRPGEVKNINVSVRWQSYDGREHQRSFTAIYAKNGLYDFYYTLARPAA